MCLLNDIHSTILLSLNIKEPISLVPNGVWLFVIYRLMWYYMLYDIRCLYPTSHHVIISHEGHELVREKRTTRPSSFRRRRNKHETPIISYINWQSGESRNGAQLSTLPTAKCSHRIIPIDIPCDKCNCRENLRASNKTLEILSR